MRTTLFAFALVLAAAVGCGNKTPNPPVGTGSDDTTGSATPVEPEPGSGSAMTPEAGSGSDAGAGSGSAAEVGAGSGSDTGTTAPAEEEDAFLAKTKDEKMDFMKTQVVPAMGKAFKAFNKKKFGKFGCKTCHSKETVADGTYKMPNPDLPKLDFAALQAGKDAKIAEFMKTTVVPDMAKLLELTPYSEDHPKGFGCMHCHTMKQ